MMVGLGMTVIDPPAEVQARLREARRRLLLARAVAVFVFAVGIAGIALFAIIRLETTPLPPSRSATLRADENYQVDVVLVDQPEMFQEDVRNAVRPMLDVLRHHWPQRPVHIRLAVYRDGFPYRLPAEQAVAAYVPEQDFFVLDARESAASHAKPEWRRMSPTTWLAFIMGHEAAHLWQTLRGDEMNNSSFDNPDAYPHDPIELEAFKEGITQASRVERRPLRWRSSTGQEIAADPFWFGAVSPRAYDLRIGHAWTVRGILLRWRDSIARLMSVPTDKKESYEYSISKPAP